MTDTTTEHPDAETRVDTHAPTNVIAALARVEAEMGGIAKLSPEQHAQRRGQQRDPNDKGITYSYRGIDQIAQAAQPLLGKYGVVMVPEVENHVIDEIVVNNKPWSDTTVTVLWRIYGPGGVDDMITARTIGQGRDNSDKGINKAMTGAYKNLLLRLLSIGDPQDDTDGITHERDNQQQPAFLTDAQAQQVVDFVVALPEPHKTAAKTEIAERWGGTRTIPATDWEAVEEFIARLNAIAAQDAAENPEPAEPADDGHLDPQIDSNGAQLDADERRKAVAERKRQQAAEAAAAARASAETTETEAQP